MDHRRASGKRRRCELAGSLPTDHRDAIIACIDGKGGQMASLSVRNLDDDLLARLKRRAARHGRSAEAEVRDILRQTLSSEADIDFDILAAELRALTSGRRHTPAEDLQREGRDER
jgi:plasmid stability protein